MEQDKDLADFQRFMRQREEAARAYVQGDGGPLDRLSARRGDATFFPPRGGHERGAEQVARVYQRDVASFEPGGETRLEILQMGADAQLGFWTGFQHATVRLRGAEGPMEMKLRITEVFRREDDGWKLVHRHADPLAAEAKR